MDGAPQFTHRPRDLRWATSLAWTERRYSLRSVAWFLFRSYSRLFCRLASTCSGVDSTPGLGFLARGFGVTFLRGFLTLGFCAGFLAGGFSVLGRPRAFCGGSSKASTNSGGFTWLTPPLPGPAGRFAAARTDWFGGRRIALSTIVPTLFRNPCLVGRSNFPPVI